MQPSLQRKLLGAFAIPTLVATLFGGWLAYSVAGRVVTSAYDQSLLNLAKGVANRARSDATGLQIALPFEAEAVLRTDTVDRIFFRVRDDLGRLVAGDADLPPAEKRVPILQPLFFESTFRGESIRGVWLHQRLEGMGFYVTVAETLGKREQALHTLLWGFAVALLLVLGAIGLASRWAIRKGLSPLSELERTLSRRSGNDLSPVDPARVPVEIRQLVAALNALFAGLERAGNQQRQFLQDAAHQLRTPLANLQLHLELLGSSPEDPALKTTLQGSVQRLIRLANQLLTLARAESGALLLVHQTPVDVAELIDDMLEDWLRISDARQIDFGVERRRSVVGGDPTLLRELVANLVDNALKYTPNGGEVTLTCAPEKGRVQIRVADTGPGIAADEREQVFERFYRSPVARGAGSGLGLAIAREIVVAHGGTIEILEADQGGGTVVAVDLPANAEHV
ncbi:sensor histidine kinase [Cognatazoarcus halotolerans]|uniref:sensor histidine kinase n=1 Tax=Cognatazoarcus halotolerans TaxID=2686016 RepID=UPI00135BCAC3|nr:sensor histidine kinase [Cognatazoarcus halotolerans]MCB1898887.1 sensor histidine kinase [Rhodocyclaceae bacterium]MCP5309106.1 sensor histidine kinase [Zoogloeaceae bacterium]